MANRITKGKALVGSLDVQGALTVNGAPVGGGGEAIVFTQDIDLSNIENYYMDWQKPKIFWQLLGNYFSRGEVYIQERVYNGGASTLNPWFADNNIQNGDIFDFVDLTYIDQNYANPYRKWVDFYPSAWVFTTGTCAYDMMSNGLTIRFQFLAAGMAQEYPQMLISELEFKKRG